VRGPALDRQVHREGEHAERDQAEDDPGVPRVLGAAPGREEQDRGREDGGEQPARVVDPAAGLRRPGQMQSSGDGPEGDDPDRQVDEEDPAPEEAVREGVAQQWPAEQGDGRDQAGERLVFRALPGRHQVAHDRLHQAVEAAPADTLHGPERDQQRQVARHSAEQRPDQEHRDRELEDPFAAVHVAELAEDQRRDRAGQ
jgi:hypothetical protein